jgi:hypothetical protein
VVPEKNAGRSFLVLKEKDIRISRFRELLRDNPRGLTIEEISKLLPLNRNSTSKYLNRMLVTGQAEMRTFGPAKVFFLSKRVSFPHLLNLSSDLIMILDQDLFIRFLNDRFLEVFRIYYMDHYGKDLDYTPFATHMSARLRNNVKEGLKGRESGFEEEIIVEGKRRFFRARCTPVVFEDGGPGVSLILMDITELMNYRMILDEITGERNSTCFTGHNPVQEEIVESES